MPFHSAGHSPAVEIDSSLSVVPSVVVTIAHTGACNLDPCWYLLSAIRILRIPQAHRIYIPL
jgi:hypothetical protein